MDLHRSLGRIAGRPGSGRSRRDIVLRGQRLDRRVGRLHLLAWLHWLCVPCEGEAALAAWGVVDLH